jgi:hypothetical protein
MKNEILNAIILTTAITGILAAGIGIGIDIQKAEVKQPQHAVIIWNDDIESLPADGEMVEIQQTINDTIYIGNID